MSCKLKYNNKYYTEEALLKKLSNNMDLVRDFLPQKEKSSYSSDYTLEELSIFEQKINFLKKTMDVEVLMDPNTDSSKVLGARDPLVKKAGKPVIIINPNKIFTTTAIHEFGHIFLDSFPNGMKNPRLKKAYEMLKGTPLESEVKEMYPELGEDMLAKEIITTAIGRKGSEIWDSVDKQNIWSSIKNWIMSYIKRVFKISSSNEIESLTRELLNNKVKKTGMSVNEQLQKSRRREVAKTDEEKAKNKDNKDSIRSLEQIYAETLARIENIYKAYKPTTDKEKSREESRAMKKRTRFESITELKEAVDELDKTDRRLGMEKYIEWVKQEVAAVSSTLEKRKEEGTLNNDNLKASVEWNKGFSMIEDMQGLVIGLHKDGQITDDEKNSYDEELSDIQKERSKLESNLLNAEREAYVDFVEKYDKKIKDDYELTFKEDYDKLGLKDSGMSKEQYVIRELERNKEEISQKTREEAHDRARESLSDIRMLEAKGWSEKNSNSQDIQLFSAVASELDDDVNQFGRSQHSEFDIDNKRYKDIKEENTSALSQTEKYKGLYDSVKGGGTYYAGKYKAEFYEERSRLIFESREREAAEKRYNDVTVTGPDLEYTIDGVTRKINIFGASDYRVLPDKDGKSFNISYFVGTMRFDLNTAQAVATSEYEYWQNENLTETLSADGSYSAEINEKWLNKEFANLSDEKRKTLDFLKSSVLSSEKDTSGSNSLVRKALGETFIKLPSILKSDTQRIAQGQYWDTVKNSLSEIVSNKKDDFETEENRNTEMGESFKRVFADISNKEKLRVPIPFRRKLENNEQSLDLHTITLMNAIAARNYKLKSEMESTMLIVMDVMANRKVPDTVGIDRVFKVHAVKPENETPIYKDKKDIIDVTQARDILESRFYGIKNKDAGKINYGTNKDGTKKSVEVNAIVRTWLKFSGWVALTLNWMNGVVNVSVGTVQNYIEAIGGEHFDVKDWAVSGKKYYGDIVNIMNDWGSNVDRSRTNLFMNSFNVFGGTDVVENKFEEGTKFQALLKMNSLRPIAKAGEHMMQSRIMYATLNNMKVMDKQGNFIDRKGNVVKNKKEAASLDEMIEFRPTPTGGIEIVLDPKVESTTHTLTGGQKKIMQEAINLVRYKVHELQGNHDPSTQAAYQREFWGKMAAYLRKWVEDGYFRRWRGTATIFKDIKDVDAFYSQDAKANREGYHVTAIRFLSKVIWPAVTQLNIDIIKEGKGELAPFQKANLRKCMAELGMLGLTLLAYMGLDEDEEDITYKYLFRRALAEQAFFIWPPDGIKVVSTPTASIGTLRSMFSIISQSLDPFEKYKQGHHKGRNKLSVKVLKATPVASQFMKDAKGGLDYLTNSSGMN